MQKKFILNLGLLLFLNLLVKPFYILGIDSEILDRLGQSSYGTYFALLNLSYLLNIILDMGISNYTTSTVSRNQNVMTKHYSAILSLRMFLSAIYIIICFVTAIVLGYHRMDLKLLLPLCFNQVLVGLILYFRSNLAALQLFKWDSIISVADRIILIITCSVVLWGRIPGLDISIPLFIYLQTAAYVVTLILAYMILRPRLMDHSLTFNMTFSRAILKKSIPYALLILLMGFYYRTDGLMLERMLENGSYEAGVYAQAFRFFEAGYMIAFLFAALLFPMFSALLNNKEQLSELTNLSFRLITVGALIAGTACIYYSENIMGLRFSTEVKASAAAFRYLMVGFTPLCLTVIFGTLLTACGFLRQLNILALGGAILNVGLNFYLIPEMKAEGAALASMVTQILMAFAQFWLVQSLTGITPGAKVLWRFLIFIPALFGLLTALSAMIGQWEVQLPAFIAIAFLLSFLLKLFSWKNVTVYLGLVKVFRSEND